jgi:hypothetical protein
MTTRGAHGPFGPLPPLVPMLDPELKAHKAKLAKAFETCEY